ncbi:LacI family transcriptional regulator [Ligilactobacillus salitolerans]|uniref:LacI family transcriptional regulator n=1 Tax=Ligilactobacillus salitolerans TaxID=1808352 RepID=A0A401IQP0_9LACO|nr:LacI family DNA-binding transcriptional regulator [Ligilactobacillus salitolerans]GBG93825.1 LacI family transcriptional regulator [Ligilactobacillus salitolerans]
MGLKEIASQAGVSIATVSRILNQDATLSVTDQTRQRVVRIANEMNYSPGKKKNHAQKIGIVTWYTKDQEQDDSYYQTLRIAVEEELKSVGYATTLIFGDSPWTNVRRCAGALAIGRFSTAQREQLKRLNAHLVFIGENTLENDLSCVTSDNEVGVKKVLNDFIEHGRDNIGILLAEGRTSDNTEKIYDRRLVDYRHHLRSKHLYRAQNVFTTNHVTRQAGYLAVKKAYKKQKEDFPTALFIASDILAVGALDFFKEQNLPVPERVSVISFNDSRVAEQTEPSLTSVKVNLSLMAQHGVELLLQNVKSEHTAVPERLIVGTSITYRDSSD